MNDIAVGDPLDAYRIMALIARSATAAIFKAVDARSGATVTIKMPHPVYEGDAIFHAHLQRALVYLHGQHVALSGRRTLRRDSLSDGRKR